TGLAPAGRAAAVVRRACTGRELLGVEVAPESLVAANSRGAEPAAHQRDLLRRAHLPCRQPAHELLGQLPRVELDAGELVAVRPLRDVKVTERVELEKGLPERAGIREVERVPAAQLLVEPDGVDLPV